MRADHHAARALPSTRPARSARSHSQAATRPLSSCTRRLSHSSLSLISSLLLASDSDVSRQLRQHFNQLGEHQKNAKLFRAWSTYESSLPVREYAVGERQILPLHKLNHWSSDDDVRLMAQQLLKTRAEFKNARATVKYVCAPSGAGKTKSIIPAFLATTRMDGGFSHYLYLAFDNNDYNHFHLTPYRPASDEGTAEEQGAAFMLDCMRTLLDEPDENGPYKIPRNDTPPTPKQSRMQLEELLRDRLGSDSRILIHVDEHYRMCNRDESDDDRHLDPGALFSRGAMQALAEINRVTVVATYTRRPPISPMRREAVLLPPLDPDKLMRDIPELDFPDPPDETSPLYERRLWATLRFRLPFALEPKVGGLHVRGSDRELEQLLAEFKAMATSSTMDTADRLRACIRLCTRDVDVDSTPVSQMTRLLLGVQDAELADLFSRQVNDLVVLPNGKLSVSFRTLLTSIDPHLRIYGEGALRLIRVLLANDRDDLLKDAPLEEAYTWTLACRAASTGNLKFTVGGPIFAVEATKLAAGRIFPGSDATQFDLSSLEPDIIYFADEPGRGSASSSHPRADIFFRTADGQLVLIDITGAGIVGKGNVTGKAQALGKTIDLMQQSVDPTELQLHGVVLAPFDSEGSMSSTTEKGNSVEIVRGRDARDLLGGLDQVFQWFA